MIVQNVIQIKSGITINVCASVKIEKHCVHRKNYIWNPDTYSCEKSKYVGSTIDDSMITSDKIMEETRTVPTSFDEKKFQYFTCLFINFYSIIDTIKILSKTKIFITIL